MTNAELITKIKARIERLKATNPSEYNYQNAEGYVCALDDLLSFLSTLESVNLADVRKTSSNDLVEAAEAEEDRVIEEVEKDDRGCPYISSTHVYNAFVRGAKWQADHTPLPEDTVLFNKGVEEGKRLMMMEAVKTRVIGLGLCDTPHVVLGLSDEFKDGDKVRIIIVKEDEK